ncbi:MAG: RIP metalloprotease RseP, partial [Deltaproteobacteria bacterium]
MTTAISFVIVLGVLIFIHELGHFAVAKFCGVGVEKFSLGFGPRVIGVRRGETEYMLSALPLGGYVKMVGEAPDEEVSEEDGARSFAGKPVWKRALIVAAGPFMNLVLAAVLFPVIFLIGIQVPAFFDRPPLIGYAAPDEAAYRAGIREGDVIDSVDGGKIKNWEEFLTAIVLSQGRPVTMDILRGGASFKAVITPQGSPDNGAAYIGAYPPMEPVVGETASGYPAMEAGVKPGDRLISINGRRITHWAEIEDIVHKDGGRKVFVVKRGADTLTIEIIPKLNKDAGVYLVGISRKQEHILRKYGFFTAVEKGVSAGVDMTGRLFSVIKGLVLGEHSLKTLGGPIMIAQVAGRAARTGLSEVLSLVAFLSLQLGIINLFPIPVLDGGHILFFGIESIKGRPLSERFMSAAQRIGVALLIALMLLVTYNDIFRLLH